MICRYAIYSYVYITTAYFIFLIVFTSIFSQFFYYYFTDNLFQLFETIFLAAIFTVGCRIV